MVESVEVRGREISRVRWIEVWYGKLQRSLQHDACASTGNFASIHVARGTRTLAFARVCLGLVVALLLPVGVD